jgi:amylosucrase
VLRLDAVPFLWKRLGTDCQNQPEVHVLLGALRDVLRIAAPATAFKAEAIVSPQQLVAYLGECDLAYHNVLMVLGWSALASGRADLLTSTLRGLPRTPPHAAWVTYVRGHDDIGWAITPDDAGAIGEDAHLHRRFLSDFYAGEFPMSFARGARFQPEPHSGEARISGSAASLAGLEAALESGDELATELAIRRIVLLHAVAFAHGGIPLVYMGDEVAMRSDPEWDRDPAHRDDNRWLHRPEMDWEAAARRHDPASIEGRVWRGLLRLVERRRGTPAVHAAGTGEPFWTGNEHVFGLRRAHRDARLLLLANFSPHAQQVDGRELEPYGYVWEAS